MSNSLYQNLANTPIQPSFLSVEILRDVLIPDLLGADTPDLSYWAGKSLAQHFPIGSLDDMIIFFQQANFGDLELTKERKDSYTFTLSGSIVQSRLHEFPDADFQLEAGFIAATLVQVFGYSAEARASVQKHEVIQIEVLTDRADQIKRHDLEDISLTPAYHGPATVETATSPTPEAPTETTQKTIQPVKPEEQSVTNLPSRRERHRRNR